MTSPAPTQAELEAHASWEREDRVPGRPQMTAFRRVLRYHQARWREANGHPIGTQPIAPRAGTDARPVGSRLPLDYALESGATFLTEGARRAATARTEAVEPRQSFDRQRLWADLLWSPTLAFNLFGDLADDAGRADRALHAWWPDTPGAVSGLRFSYSPGWLDPQFLRSLRAFDATFFLERDDGSQALVAVDTKYHDRAKAEIPKPENLPRYLEVARRSRIFRRGAPEKLGGRSELAVTWLEHLLLLSMLQHGSGRWTWGRYVVVYPAGNSDVADLCRRYAELLADRSTFAWMTLEQLLDARALAARTTRALRARYLPSDRTVRAV
jgi:hypothetical protein